MSNPPPTAGNGGEDGSKSDLEKTMAKTAGFVVFSGIAISILKALNPFNSSTPTLSESTHTEKPLTKTPPPCCRSSQQPPLLQAPVTASVKPNVMEVVEQNVVESTGKAVEIVKGDTLWGLSRKYGVPIQEIKEANGLTSDTIYAGKKLVIP
ncbi:probable endopeptidase p60 [Salvia splendens]|uniref:probable endopeptidase p60 n=1 Tax=Salvia splendens TaxID=180675 RepID=UPI001C25FA80|nr:probable endopeptidase p60 [Salvia splendens]